MFNNLFSKPTTGDLLKVLQKEPFNESKADSILEHVKINSLDNNGKTFLHHLCSEDIVEPINWLVKNGIDKEIEDYYDDSALNTAIKSDSFNAFNLLLKLGYNVDKQNRNGRTILQDSLLLSDTKFYKKIKEHTKNINNIDKNGQNLLFDVIASGNVSLIEELLLEDIDKNLINKQGRPAFLQESVVNNFKVLKLLTDNNVDISIKDKDGNNLLYYVFKNKTINEKILEFAIENKIDLNAVNNQGNTILIEMIHIINDHDNELTSDVEKEKILLQTMDTLLGNGLDVNIVNSNGQSALMLSAKFNNEDITKKLINNGADINCSDNSGNTALSLAAIKGHTYKAITHLLVSNKASVYIKDNNEQTIIDKLIDAILHQNNKKRISSKLVMKMCDNCDYQVVLKDMLNNTKIDLYSLNSNDEPYFFEPIKYGNLNLFKLLIHTGYHINQPDKKGLNIIYKLMDTFKELSNEEQKNYFTSLKLLLDMRANVNATDGFGGTTLHKAILENDVQTVKMLMNANANMDAKDKQGRNFMHNSVWKNRVQIMRVIHSNNAKLINTPDNYGVLPINYAAFLGYTDLVVELISLGSVINNPTPKKQYILDFLKKFHKNIFPMFKNTRNSTDERHVAKLIKNMRSEFQF